MKNLAILCFIFLNFSIPVKGFSAVNDGIQSQLIFFTQKKNPMNYEIKKDSDKPESFTIHLKEMNQPEMKADLSPADAKLLLTEMNTTLWDFQYKSKSVKSPCDPFATLIVKDHSTTICRSEKSKASKTLGLIGRLNYLLKKK
jgi:hypothetical protein